MSETETLTAAEIATLPIDEQMYFALLAAGLDEDDAQAAQEVILPLVAGHLRGLAGEAEWRFRSMTFFRGGCASETRLHGVGKMLRDCADALATRSAPTTAAGDDGEGVGA